MSGRVILSLAIHNHQPVGNFAHVFEAAYQQAYLPMAEALQRHPRIRVALHYSGPLLDWLAQSHPDFFPRLRTLAARDQVEILTGGYDEPILAIIPDADKVGQIRKLTASVQRRFGTRARGLWLAERVWEPHLPKLIAQAGVEYTIVDDTHFIAAGLSDSDLVGYFVTEEDGAVLKIFPSLKRLRYLIPWQSPEEVLAYLQAAQAAPGADTPVFLMGDDGEKFGLWPGTYALCWERGWIEKFFSAVEAASEWLTLLPPGEAAQRPSEGRVYLPTASYDEMMEWVLPPDRSAEFSEITHRLADRGDPAVRYLRGGFWRQFLVKYPEINTMHKRMLRVSRKVHAMRAGPRRTQAFQDLWAGQCNEPYWHGVFGGIYLPHIRRATFGHLIAAEDLADRGRAVGTELVDLDADGAPEVELASPAMVVAVDPRDGGGVVEWQWRAARVNLTNVLSRRPEAYHRQLQQRTASESSTSGVETIHTTRVRVKEPGLERLLVYDRYRHASFLDHVLAPDATVEAFARGEYHELGTFVTGTYEPTLTRARGGVAVSLVREGTVMVAGRSVPLRVEKQLTVSSTAPEMTVSYRVHNAGSERLAARFGVETVWAVTDPASPIRVDERSVPARELAVMAQAHMVSFTDWGWPRAVSLRLPPGEVWVHPLETVSNSEAGFERIFQGVVCLCLWDVTLQPQESREVVLQCALGEGNSV
jgi:4-alpha-glucanotransferase